LRNSAELQEEPGIRRRLLLLGLCVLVPVLAFAVLASVMLVRDEEKSFQQAAIGRARAMMSAVDAKLHGSITTLLAVAVSPALDAGDLAAFHEGAVRILQSQPDWSDITLALPSGERVLDGREPFGQPLPPVTDAASLQRVIQIAGPAVGDVVARADGSPKSGVPIRVPVLRHGEIVYVLTANVRYESFAALIGQQQLPADWVSGIVDSHGNFVARAPAMPVGSPASPAFRAAAAGAKEGWYRGRTVEGRDAYTAYEHSEFAGWTIGLGIPATLVLAGAHRTGWVMAAAAAAAVALTLLIAIAGSRRIITAMSRLADMARALPEEKAPLPPVPPAGIREIDDIARTLESAAVALRERQSLIRREKEALQASDRAKNEFIAALSHELRNPLAALTSGATLLRLSEPGSVRSEKGRQIIDRQLAHMARMIEDLLDISRVVAGKLHIERETLDIGRLVQETVFTWQQAQAGLFGMSVQTRHVSVDGDRTRLQQVLVNLLDNALKSTGGAGPIEVAVGVDGDDAVITVRDHGEGIPAEMIDKIFDAFTQGAQGISRPRGGLGLGLTLAKRLTELLGGTISARSGGAAQGATFEVRLPVSKAVVPSGDLPEPVVPAGKPAQGRIVVIDDNEDARDSLGDLLELEGYEVDRARTGEEGVAMVLMRAPDVVLLDIGLPDIDGFEVARRIRSRSKDAVKLVAVSGYGQPDDKRGAADAGIDQYLVKPVTLAEIKAAIAAPAAVRTPPAEPAASRQEDSPS